MKAWDFDAVVYDGAVYCNECCPVPVDSDEVAPIFASNEWDHAPTCDACGEIHDYMNLIEQPEEDNEGEGEAEEIAVANFAELMEGVMTESRIARFRENVIDMANDAGFDGEELAKQFDKMIERASEEQASEPIRNDDPDEEQAGEEFEPYYTIVVPWVPDDERTEWHPTEQFGIWSKLNRGAFKTEKEARQWAREHLNGNPYSVEKR